jgi:Protein of unknown function (DUF1302)
MCFGRKFIRVQLREKVGGSGQRSECSTSMCPKVKNNGDNMNTNWTGATRRSKNPPRNRICPLALAVLTVCGPVGATEIELDNTDYTLRWDNTVKYSAGFRLKGADAALVAPSAANNDDGDRNFGKGLISNRVDLFSELDLVHKDGWGGRVSAAAWYDSVYNRSNDNPGFSGGAFPNRASSAGSTFSSETRELHGRKAELLDAFVFGRTEIGSMPLTLRLGQHAVLYGESLFFGANGIAAAQAPVDVVKLLSVPGTQFKEAIMPVPQISGQLQLNSDVSLGAYWQFKFKANRLPAAGSYFSQTDTLQDGAEQLLLGPLGVAPRLADQRAKNSGQGGLQVKWRVNETDLGFYAVRFHEKTPQLVTSIGFSPAINSAVPSSYRLVYHENITAFGTSASHTFGDFNVAAEASLRHNQDLANAKAADLSALGLGAPTNNSNNTGYPVGRTAHLNLNTLATLGRTPLWNEASFLAEVAWNRVLKVTRGTADSNATRSAWGVRMQLEPTYRQVLPGLDIGIPVGMSYAPKNSRSLALGPGALPPAGGGDVSVGLNGSYLDTWRFTLSWTHYYGKAEPIVNATASAFTYGQSLKDRDFIAVSVRRTF